MSRTAIARAMLPFTAANASLRPGIRILMYHRVAPLAGRDQLNVAPERFARQVAHLARTRELVSLEEAVARLARGGRLRDAVAITFDDGYLDNLVHALPVLRRHGAPATIFVTAAFCGQGRRHPRYRDEPGRLHLDWDEVRALASEPGIAIGSHALTHPYLSRLADADAWREIADSKREIEARIGRPVAHFCYPSGDATAREREMVRRAGYTAAVTVAPGANRALGDGCALRRTEVTDADEPAQLDLKLRGAFDPMHAVLHWRRNRAFARARSHPAAEVAR